MAAIITNKSIEIPLADLTLAETLLIKANCTYKDKSVEYAIRQASKSMWGAKRIPELKTKLTITLYEETPETLIIPQGMAHLIPSHIILIDKRVLPLFREMVWYQKPKHDMRYYQREAVEALMSDSRGQAVLSTGSGKSFLMLNLVKKMGLQTLIICPSSLIGDQLYDDFASALSRRQVGMFGSGKKEVKQITVGLYQSVTRNIEVFKNTELIVVDESQTIASNSLTAISRGLSHVPYFYSVSATNWRADGKTPEIYAASGNVKYTFDTLRAISEGFLSQPVFIIREVPSSGKEYELKQKNYTHHVVKNNILNAQIVADIQRARSMGMSTLILVQEIEHGEMIASAENIPFANGENKKSMQLIKQLNVGSIKTLIAGASLAGVGTNFTRVDCLIMASFPGTKGLTLQLLGRGLRKYEGKKKLLVLDYSIKNNNMLFRHSQSRIEWYSELGEVKIIRSKDEF